MVNRKTRSPGHQASRQPGHQTTRLPGRRSTSSLRILKLQFTLALILLTLSACGAPPEPPPPPEEIITRAVDNMTGQPGFAFAIDRSGGPAYIDPDQTISFRRAEGSYTAPDSAQATVRVIVPGLVAEVSMVAIGERYWETNVVTGEWVEVPAGQAFNPANLFDSARGLPMLLSAGLGEIRFEGTAELEELPGLELFHVTAVMDTTDLYPLTFGLIGPEPAAVELFVEPGTFLLHRVVITEAVESPDAEPSVWQVDFWDFGTTAEIVPPLP